MIPHSTITTENSFKSRRLKIKIAVEALKSNIFNRYKRGADLINFNNLRRLVVELGGGHLGQCKESKVADTKTDTATLSVTQIIGSPTFWSRSWYIWQNIQVQNNWQASIVARHKDRIRQTIIRPKRQSVTSLIINAGQCDRKRHSQNHYQKNNRHRQNFGVKFKQTF